MRGQPPVSSADANETNRRYLDSILIEQRLIDAVEPCLETWIFGERFLTPIMMPAFSHLKRFLKERENAMVEYAKAAKQLGMLNWVGMCEDEELGEILSVGAKTARIIKPYADKEKIFRQIAYAEKRGAFAVGMDIDHIPGSDGRYDVVMGEAMAGQNGDDIRAYVQSTKLPFILKGVLSAADAKKSAECGVRGIVVSHHHGRMPYAVPPLMVLPEIKKAVSQVPGFEIFVDCGMERGADVYKALALGAAAASVGRAIMPPLAEKGCEGVVQYVQKMNDELAEVMCFTGCSTVSDIVEDVLWINGTRRKP